MNNKQIAKYGLSFIGGKPTVYRYYNSDNTKQIDIMKSEYGYVKGINTFSTIGLNTVDIGLMTKNNVLRIELMMCSIEDNIPLGNILSTIVFNIMDSNYCVYGSVYENVIGEYIKTPIKNVVLLSPVFWEKYKAFSQNGITVSWLLAVPIFDEEMNFINKNGIDKFDEILEKSNVNIFDFSRKSVL